MLHSTHGTIKSACKGRAPSSPEITRGYWGRIPPTNRAAIMRTDRNDYAFHAARRAPRDKAATLDLRARRDTDAGHAARRAANRKPAPRHLKTWPELVAVSIAVAAMVAPLLAIAGGAA